MPLPAQELTLLQKFQPQSEKLFLKMDRCWWATSDHGLKCAEYHVKSVKNVEHREKNLSSAHRKTKKRVRWCTAAHFHKRKPKLFFVVNLQSASPSTTMIPFPGGLGGAWHCTKLEFSNTAKLKED
jgi:hypothetical protein